MLIAHVLSCPVGRKTLADLESSPGDVTYAEIVAVLRAHGWSVREGTRHGAIATKAGEPPLTIPRPHGKDMKTVYVRAVAKRLRGDEP